MIFVSLLLVVVIASGILEIFIRSLVVAVVTCLAVISNFFFGIIGSIFLVVLLLVISVFLFFFIVLILLFVLVVIVLLGVSVVVSVFVTLVFVVTVIVVASFVILLTVHVRVSTLVVVDVILSVVVVSIVGIVVVLLVIVAAASEERSVAGTTYRRWCVSSKGNLLGDLVQEISLVLGGVTSLGFRCLKTSGSGKDNRVFHIIHNNTLVRRHVSGHGGVDDTSIEECSVGRRVDAIVQKELGPDIGTFFVDSQERISDGSNMSLGKKSDALVEVLLVDHSTIHDFLGEGDQIGKLAAAAFISSKGMRLDNDGRNVLLLEKGSIRVVERHERKFTSVSEDHVLGHVTKDKVIPTVVETLLCLVFTVRIFLEARVLAVIDERSHCVSGSNRFVNSSQELRDRAGSHIIQVRGISLRGLKGDTVGHCGSGGPLVVHTVSGHEDLQDVCLGVDDGILCDVTASHFFNDTREIIDVKVGVSNERNVDVCREGRGTSSSSHQGDDSDGSDGSSGHDGNLCGLREAKPQCENGSPSRGQAIRHSCSLGNLLFGVLFQGVRSFFFRNTNADNIVRTSDFGGWRILGRWRIHYGGLLVLFSSKQTHD
mmetsp:Transcript_20624/g.51271  ORF Transcript_20624/g.51271 Transcript_20624/m.51271 type:complete len:598 (+) Transcript_20624:225-2018(+)